MGSPLVTLPAGVMAAGVPASAMTGANSRVKTQTGPLGIATDVVQFPGPLVTGTWTQTNSRVFVNHILTVSTTSIGVAAGPSPPYSGLMIVSLGDSRVSGS